MTTPTTTSIENGDMQLVMEHNIVKEKMLKSAEKCGSALIQYYLISGIPSQEKKMRYMLRDLLYQKTEEAEYICEEIYQEANTHLAAAMKYGYQPKDLEDLRSCIDEYKGIIKIQRQVIEGKKTVFDFVVEKERWVKKAI